MQEIVSKIQQKFGEEIKRKLDKRHVANSPNQLISHSFNLLHFTNELLCVLPEILCGYIAGGKLREDVILKNAEKCLSLKNRDGVLLCHALSPYSESIGFYCDLGRAFRISKGLSLPLKVMLAGKQWTNYNWVVTDLKLKNNLPKNEEWRKKVYSTLFDIEADVLSVDDVQTDFKVDIHAEANEYVTLLIKMFGANVTKKKFTDDEVEELLSREHLFFELSELNILKNGIRPIRATIECVLRNFKRADEETFIYFLTQYYHQSRYNGYIKVSMKREKDFDDSFRDIHKIFTASEVKHDNLIGLYLEDYKYGQKGDKQITVHPYYFPSGSLYGIFNKNLKSAVKNCIMIGDYNDKEKIKRILSSLNYFQRARILSDLLSFAHALSLKHEYIKHSISRWFKMKKPEYYFYSWETFTNKNNQGEISQFMDDWTDLIFSTWATHDNFPIPYWFLPFFWDDKTNSSDTKVTIDQQVELVSIILTEANNNLGLPILAIDPIKDSANKKFK